MYVGGGRYLLLRPIDVYVRSYSRLYVLMAALDIRTAL